MRLNLGLRGNPALTDPSPSPRPAAPVHLTARPRRQSPGHMQPPHSQHRPAIPTPMKRPQPIAAAREMRTTIAAVRSPEKNLLISSLPDQPPPPRPA